MLAYVSALQWAPLAAEQAVRHALLDVAGLILFLLVAMTYINALAGYFQFFGYYLRMTHGRWQYRDGDRATVVGDMTPFDVFNPDVCRGLPCPRLRCTLIFA